MTPAELQNLFLERLGLRVGPETAAYALRTWSEAGRGIPVIASDARTGVALRRVVGPEQLTAGLSADPSPATA